MRTRIKIDKNYTASVYYDKKEDICKIYIFFKTEVVHSFHTHKSNLKTEIEERIESHKDYQINFLKNKL